MKIVWSDKAERDLLQAYAYLAERNPQAADAVRVIDGHMDIDEEFKR
jgi:plasmid stabilization system protein ParE